MILSEFFKRNNNNLDLIRLFLALIVIYGHVPAFKGVAPGYVDFATRIFPFTYSGALAVKSFFLISGLLVTNSILTKKNYKTYIVSRVFRIYPALVFASCVIVLACSFIFNLSGPEFISESLKYLKGVFLMKLNYSLAGVSFCGPDSPAVHCNTVNGSIWTIPLEIKMYATLLAIYILSVSFVCNEKILIAVFGLLSVAPILVDPPLMGGGDNEEVTFLIASFFAGSVLAVLKEKIFIDWKLVISMFVLYHVVETPSIKHWLCYVSVPIALIWISTLPIVNRIRLASDISYGVYVWGWFIQVVVQFFYPELSYLSYLCVCILVSIVIAYFSAKVIEEPSMRLAQVINKKITQGTNRIKHSS